MRSARRQSFVTRFVVAGCAGALLVGSLAGCETTQEKAAKHQAEAERILDARAERQAARKQTKQKGKADKSDQNGGKKQ